MPMTSMLFMAAILLLSTSAVFKTSEENRLSKLFEIGPLICACTQEGSMSAGSSVFFEFTALSHVFVYIWWFWYLIMWIT